MPPSAINSIPFMKALSADARNNAACANSSAAPRRPAGIKLAIWFRKAGRCSFDIPNLPMIGVSTGPGLSTFTLMRRSRSSNAQLRANAVRAAFDPA